MNQFVRGKNPHKALRIGEYTHPEIGNEYYVTTNLYTNGDGVYRTDINAFRKNTLELRIGDQFMIDEMDGVIWADRLVKGKITGEDIGFDWFIENHTKYFARA